MHFERIGGGALRHTECGRHHRAKGTDRRDEACGSGSGSPPSGWRPSTDSAGAGRQRRKLPVYDQSDFGESKSEEILRVESAIGGYGEFRNRKRGKGVG